MGIFVFNHDQLFCILHVYYMLMSNQRQYCKKLALAIADELKTDKKEDSWFIM